MSEYRAYMQNTKLHNGTKRKKRRHRFLFGVLLSALLITGALYGREYDISQLKNIDHLSGKSVFSSSCVER